jgi:hypothetical protein
MNAIGNAFAAKTYWGNALYLKARLGYSYAYSLSFTVLDVAKR